MPSLKDVKVKIAGVGKTKQITKAMYMVASAKLRGAQSRIERFRPYAEKFYDILGDLAGHTDGVSHPLLDRHKDNKCSLIIVITSDRGLCGSLNVALVARTLDAARKRWSDGRELSFLCVGKKGRDAVRKIDGKIIAEYTDELSNFDFSLASVIGKQVISAYETMAADEVLVIYPEFHSLSTQTPSSLPLLPIEARHGMDKEIAPATATLPPTDDEEFEIAGHSEQQVQEYIYEPQAGQLLAQLLPTYVNVQLFRALLDAAASENAARMMAMDNATRNCNDMISTLTLLYNKTRQASITSELIDIVGGAEALNA